MRTCYRPSMMSAITLEEQLRQYEISKRDLLCELRIHYDQTRVDCGKTNQGCSGEFYIVYVECKV